MIEVPPSDDTSVNARLADLLSLDPEAPEVWSDEDLTAIWQHLLNTPLATELGRIPTADLEIRKWEKAARVAEPTFGDLLHHEHPPLELLNAVKRFGKNVCQWERSFPPEIAKAVYYAAIAVALVRCGKRISKLEKAALSEGLAWVSSQRWADGQTRDVCSAATS